MINSDSDILRLFNELIQQGKLAIYDSVDVTGGSNGWFCKPFEAQNMSTLMACSWYGSDDGFTSKKKAKVDALRVVLTELGFLRNQGTTELRFELEQVQLQLSKVIASLPIVN